MKIKEFKDLFIKIENVDHFKDCQKVYPHNFYDKNHDYVSLTTSLLRNLTNDDIEDLWWLTRKELTVSDLSKVIENKENVYAYDCLKKELNLLTYNDLLKLDTKSLFNLSFYGYN